MWVGFIKGVGTGPCLSERRDRAKSEHQSPTSPHHLANFVCYCYPRPHFQVALSSCSSKSSSKVIWIWIFSVWNFTVILSNKGEKAKKVFFFFKWCGEESSLKIDFNNPLFPCKSFLIHAPTSTLQSHIQPFIHTHTNRLRGICVRQTQIHAHTIPNCGLWFDSLHIHIEGHFYVNSRLFCIPWHCHSLLQQH